MHKQVVWRNASLTRIEALAPRNTARCNLYIGIGHWGYLAYEQHGTVRFTADSQSAEVAKRNSTVLVLSTELSLSELSSKVNGNASGKPQAFKLIKVVADSSSDL